jgi:hypothetical protein
MAGQVDTDEIVLAQSFEDRLCSDRVGALMTKISSLFLVIKARPVDPKKLFGTSRYAGPNKRSGLVSFLNIREICVFCKAEPAPGKDSFGLLFPCGRAF